MSLRARRWTTGQANSLPYLHAGVVPGGKVVGAQRERALHQEAETDQAVAVEARVWRGRFGVAVDPGIDHALFEDALRVNIVERDAQLSRNGACIGHRFRRATAVGVRGAVRVVAILCPQA